MKSASPHSYRTSAALLTAVVLLGWAGCDRCLALAGKLVFFEDSACAGAYLLWGSGEYKMTDREHIRLSAVTSPGVYQFKISRKTLTFKNDWDCEFKYVREESD